MAAMGFIISYVSRRNDCTYLVPFNNFYTQNLVLFFYALGKARPAYQPTSLPAYQPTRSQSKPEAGGSGGNNAE